ncbi:MAG: type II toxin-antitoxin system PemK/MazF family toxin [bacterium]|nr:type II toxin-antitoxin system PemK/MazF family toxin [bacterium]
MKRGDLYRVYKGSKRDPKKYRVFVVVSRQVLIESKFSTVICAPVYSNFNAISTQISVGVTEGLKHDSCIYCDELMSIPKSALTHYIGALSYEKLEELNRALKIALTLEEFDG